MLNKFKYKYISSCLAKKSIKTRLMQRHKRLDCNHASNILYMCINESFQPNIYINGEINLNNPANIL